MQKWSDNQQLLPSYEMNIPRVVVFLERKQPLEGWQFDVHLIRRQSLLYYTESTQGCFITWMLCFEENQIISGIGNAITEPDCIKRIFVGQGCLWTSVSLYIICVLVVHRVVSLVFKTSKMYCKEIYKVYGLGVWRYFSYRVTVSIIGGGNWSTRRNPRTCRQSLTKLYYIMLYRVQLAWAEFNWHTNTATTIPNTYMVY